MASTIVLPLTLSTPPSSWSASSSSSKLSTPTQLPIYAAGPSYIAACRRQLLQHSFEDDDKVAAEVRAAKEAELKGQQGAELYPGLGEEKEDRSLLSMDAKEWKKQDHYAVLGLGHLRYKATDDHIRVAHRRKVLRHHPDKKAGSGGGTNDDNFFKCINKAFDVLTNPEKRRQFDSVDPAIEDHVPNPKDVPAAEFCDVYGPIFEREARFSKVQPVPALGGMDATKPEVEKFYDFWYNFDSWRSFEYHDKEANEGTDSRDEKRYTEKKNKADRARAKKEDNTRLREMVDMVLAADPRIKRFRQEEKAAREAKKGGAAANGKAGGAGGASKKPMTLAEKKAQAAKELAEAQKAAEEAKAREAEDKVSRDAAKKAREAAKKNLKKWRKAIATVVSESNYFQPDGSAASASVIEKQLGELDALCELLEPEQVRQLKEEVEKAGKGEAAKEAIKRKAAEAAGKEGGAGKFTEFA